MTLAGRTALIVGAAGGIGSAIAYAFAAEGATLVLADHEQRHLAEVAEGCRSVGAAARTEFVDLRDETSVRDLARAAEGPDILVNCAGLLLEAPLEEITTEDFGRLMDVTLRGVFLSCREVAPAMKVRGSGRIINVASQLGITGGARLSHYAAAKAGVLGFTKSIARELAPHNVLVNAIAPGPIDTAMTASITGEWKDAKLRELPLGRFGRPEEVAPSAVLLASDPGGNLYVGQTLGPNSGDVMP
ncbi:SDR family NAD(P)-dependent oxidoreductase [Nostocoides sp. HKS02]|uniref:SDR family NAD(P)-dependent oxidoreductase n=1 Tax=Nostocoides sp. HKS02 TaxID=1813880 RepID=UPI0012B47092|nr:SDR family NAD(P)-dependent oxidoreductase [Tetrasphaera sp. HKS02]QGN58865.1 SDR family oxidoreductase [Tetrasphaera sp. HKS02]